MSKAKKQSPRKSNVAVDQTPDPAAYSPPPPTSSDVPDPVPTAFTAELPEQPPTVVQPAPPGVSPEMAAAVAAALEAHKKALSTPPPVARKKGANISKSGVASPVKLVHAIAQKMFEANPGVTRKEVIAACEAAQIATHTAKTQYQLWRAASRNDAAAASRPIAPPPSVGRTEPKLVSVRAGKKAS